MRSDADLFFEDLMGGSTSNLREPFFDDRASDAWTVIAAPGSPSVLLDLRDDDVVVRRRPHRGDWRCRLMADVDPRILRGSSGVVPANVLILRRHDSRAAVAAIAPLREEQAADATCPPPKGSAIAYFFKGSGYLRYNIATDLVDVGPVAISQFWHLPADFQSNLDAAVNWGDGHAYLFKRANYVRYNIATDRTDLGPAPISRDWTQLPAEFQSNLDAAVNWGDGHAFFFKGSRCLRYNIATSTVDLAPTGIAQFWTHLPAEFQSQLDSVVTWGDGHAYFFKGSRYVRYNIATNLVDVGPAAISQFWTHLPATFQSGIKAAINWTHPVNLADLMRAAGIIVTESAGWKTRGTDACFTPVGTVMHHTVGLGTGTLNDIVTNNKANFFVAKSGALTVVAVGRANHAGKGSQQVLDDVAAGIAPTGTAAARHLPDGPFGNGHFYGFENENKGDGVDPWPAAQLDTMARGAAALCQLHGWSANRVIAHKEWTSRKIDPKGVDMDAFRARVASFF